MDWEELLPFMVVGGIVIAAMSAMRPAQPTVINPNPPTPPHEDDSARLQAAIQLAELAVQRDIARMQAEAELRGRQYELEAKRQEADLERQRIEAEREAAQSQAQASFWSSIWSGLFGLGAAILAGFSDEALYQGAIPSYYPQAGQLAHLARRDYGDLTWVMPILVPPQEPAPLDTDQPTPPDQDIGLVPLPPVIYSLSPSFSVPSPSPTNSTAPSQDDPLYTLIGSLIQSRPNIPTGTQPVTVVPPSPVNPMPFVLVTVIAVIGLVAYGYISRTSDR